MARLEVEIGGTTTGLGQAANQALGILENLQNIADNLKIELFKATDVATLNATGSALTTVTGKIKDYTNAAIKGSTAFQDQQSSAILDALGVKLTVLTGNAQLFGDSIKNQQAQVKAYQDAISKLLANGLNPLDSRITSLKGNIDSLNTSITSASTVSLSSQFEATGRLIPDLESKIKRLRSALSNATDERSIAQYNIRLQTAQTELDRLRTIGISTASGLTASANAAANSAKKLGSVYNGVSLEFGRIIQDAPFAANNFGAIGNNITRLTELIPGYITQTRAAIVAQGGVATSANVAKTALGGLFTGFAGVSLAISALVAGYVFYQQYQQKAKREQDALNGVTKEYIETLHGVERAQLQGSKSAQGDLVNVELLYKAYQNANIPLEARKTAYKQLQQLYPDYFKNIGFEADASDKTRKAYDTLTQSILASARARAAANIITKNSERGLENESKAAAIQAQIDKERVKTAAALKNSGNQRAAGSAGVGAAQGQGEAELRARAEKRILDLKSKQANINTDTKKLNEQNLDLQKKVNVEIAKGGTLVDLNNHKTKKAKKVPDKVTPLLDASQNSADLAGLQGVDVDVEKVRQKYEKIYDTITKASAAKGADLDKLNAQRDQAQVNEAKEISQIIIGENTRVANEVQRINDESGVKAAESRDKELASVQNWYNTQIILAQGNAVIIASIEEGAQAQRDAINQKYIDKREVAEQKIIDKIQTLSDKSFKSNENNTIKASKAIDDELAKRLAAITKYYEQIKKLYDNDPLAQQGIAIGELAVKANIKNNATTAKDGGLGRELNKAVLKFGQDFFKTLTTLNQQTDQSFKNIFSTLTSGFTSAMDDIFLNVFQKKLTASFDSATTKLGAGLTGALAGAGLLGGAISGITKKTSTVGQAAGGALSGAASGAIIGSAVPGLGTLAGGIIGGALGALGGIFGSSKARKQEELQKQQLAESEKQTKLLERQNALAYTASIIGRNTVNGVVTGVEINEFGQLTTKISGQDLLITLDRANRSRQRGT